jgi:glycosyltransferase involved in cell wall biosynthesis
LAQRHRITLIAHRNAEAEDANRFLREHGIQTVLVNRTVPAKSGLSFYARLVANLVSPFPYSVASHSSEALRNAVRTFPDGQRVDLWQAEATALIDALADLDGVPKVVIAHNVESLIWQRYFEVEPKPVKRWYIKRQWHKFERFERRALAAASRVVAVSDQDARLIRGQFAVQRVDVVDNGIDRPYFEAVQANRDPRQILFLGGFDWRPNLDAVELLLEQVFPAVRAAEPSAHLCLVGRRPPETLVRRISTITGVDLHADVPDVRPYLAKSGVMVVPLRIGGGSRLKILEALATGLPVVSTSVGAEGLELVAGRHYVAADDSEALARKLLACLRDPAPARAMAEQGRQRVLERYDWDHLADRLERVWFDCVDCRTPRFVEVGPS